MIQSEPVYKLLNNEWQLYASYSLRLEEATKESLVCGRVNGNSLSMSVSRMAMANDSINFMMKSSAVSGVFIPFHTSSVLLIGYCKSDPRSHSVLALVQLWNISPRPLQTFVQLEQCAMV